jgi:hypothetical protein
MNFGFTEYIVRPSPRRRDLPDGTNRYQFKFMAPALSRLIL